MNLRTPNNEPYFWVSKSVARKIRASFDSASTVASALSVYAALAEISSNEGGLATFSVTHAYIAGLCGLSVRTVQARLKDLETIKVVQVVTPTLKAPSHYTLR